MPNSISNAPVPLDLANLLAGKGVASTELAAPDLKATGLTGSVAASRYVGATTTGAPTTGAHLVGDFVIDQTGKIWVCTVAGTPGTFVAVGAAAGPTIQQGIVNYPANSTGIAVALPAAFVDANYSVVASADYFINGTDTGLAALAQRNTASSFNLQVNFQPGHAAAWAPPTFALTVEWIAVHA